MEIGQKKWRLLFSSITVFSLFDLIRLIQYLPIKSA